MENNLKYQVKYTELLLFSYIIFTYIINIFSTYL